MIYKLLRRNLLLCKNNCCKSCCCKYCCKSNRCCRIACIYAILIVLTSVWRSCRLLRLWWSWSRLAWFFAWLWYNWRLTRSIEYYPVTFLICNSSTIFLSLCRFYIWNIDVASVCCSVNLNIACLSLWILWRISYISFCILIRNEVIEDNLCCFGIILDSPNICTFNLDSFLSWPCCVLFRSPPVSTNFSPLWFAIIEEIILREVFFAELLSCFLICFCILTSWNFWNWRLLWRLWRLWRYRSWSFWLFCANIPCVNTALTCTSIKVNCYILAILLFCERAVVLAISCNTICISCTPAIIPTAVCTNLISRNCTLFRNRNWYGCCVKTVAIFICKSYIAFPGIEIADNAICSALCFKIFINSWCWSCWSNNYRSYCCTCKKNA